MSRFSGLSSRIRPVAVVLTVGSIVVAGILAQLRDAGIARDVERVAIGEAAPVADGQTLSVTSVVGGTAHRGRSSTYNDSTLGRFLLVTLRTTTADATKVGVVRCEAITAREGVLQPVLLTNVEMPEPGFAISQQLLFEVAVNDLEHLTLRCKESSVLKHRDASIVIDFGFTGDRLAEFVKKSETAEVRSQDDDVVEVNR